MSFAGTAQARPIPTGGVTAQDVVGVLRARGLPVQLQRDEAGDPQIVSVLHDLKFFVNFYNCQGARCGAIQFRAGFDMPNGMTMRQVNTWHAQRRYGKVFLDEVNDPFIDMDVDVYRGSTTESIDNNLETWAIILKQFKDYIGF